MFHPAMMEKNKIDLKELTKTQLVAWLTENDIQPYRALQVFKWVYLRQADDFEVMTDLGKDLRKRLSAHFTIARLEKTRVETSRDGTLKYLFKLRDGKHIESVLIPERNYYTLCVSSQVGCAQGCRFCRTAQMGLLRNLSIGEMISQVRDVLMDLRDSQRLSNIVFMGMGEPLANYDNLIGAIKTITDSDVGLKFSNRRVTVSTVGLVQKLSLLGRDTGVNLAISLNAADNRTRDKIMPINLKNPIEKLIEACRLYPIPPGRRITVAYVLIKGINDSLEDANRLVSLLRPLKVKINLIPFNEHEGCEFLSPEDAAVNRFQEILVRNHYTTIIRHSKGGDISAACGQLSGNWKPDI